VITSSFLVDEQQLCFVYTLDGNSGNVISTWKHDWYCFIDGAWIFSINQLSYTTWDCKGNPILTNFNMPVTNSYAVYRVSPVSPTSPFYVLANNFYSNTRNRIIVISENYYQLYSYHNTQFFSVDSPLPNPYNGNLLLYNSTSENPWDYGGTYVCIDTATMKIKWSIPIIHIYQVLNNINQFFVSHDQKTLYFFGAYSQAVDFETGTVLWTNLDDGKHQNLIVQSKDDATIWSNRMGNDNYVDQINPSTGESIAISKALSPPLGKFVYTPFLYGANMTAATGYYFPQVFGVIDLNSKH